MADLLAEEAEAEGAAKPHPNAAAFDGLLARVKELPKDDVSAAASLPNFFASSRRRRLRDLARSRGAAAIIRPHPRAGAAIPATSRDPAASPRPSAPSEYPP